MRREQGVSLIILREAHRSITPSPRKRLSCSHILPGGRWADSVNYQLIRGSSRWLESNSDWGGLATAAWKKGGPFACGTGGAAMLVYPPVGREPRARDSIHAFPAQWRGDGW